MREAREREIEATIEPKLRQIEAKMQESVQKKQQKLRFQSESLKFKNDCNQNRLYYVRHEQDQADEERRKQLEKLQVKRVERLKHELTEQMDNYQSYK